MPSIILVVVKLGEIDNIYFVYLLGPSVPTPLVILWRGKQQQQHVERRNVEQE